jgi:hypothetical protein
MSLKHGKLGGLVSSVLGGAVALISCSSGTTGSTGVDGGEDAPIMVVLRPDGGSGSSGSSGGSGGSGSSSGGGTSSGSSSGGSVSMDAGADASLYDGTVGQACQSNADCLPAGGPGLNVCSSSAGFSGGALYSTGVCIQIGCSSASTATTTHFCDGPDNSSSPGVCLSAGGGNTVCLPKCTIAADGSAATGCLNKTVCNPLAFSENTAGTAVTAGVGFCFHGCTADADCPTGNKCQVDQGLCLTTVTPPTKVAGTPCTSADNGTATTPAACNCILFNNAADGGAGANGICAPFCATGTSSGSGCAAGFVCDALLQTSFNDGGIAGFATQSPGLGGNCFPKCGAAGADAGDAGGGCPTGSTCSSLNVVGPDCLPL